MVVVSLAKRSGLTLIHMKLNYQNQNANDVFEMRKLIEVGIKIHISQAVFIKCS